MQFLRVSMAAAYFLVQLLLLIMQISITVFESGVFYQRQCFPWKKTGDCHPRKHTSPSVLAISAVDDIDRIIGWQCRPLNDPGKPNRKCACCCFTPSHSLTQSQCKGRWGTKIRETFNCLLISRSDLNGIDSVPHHSPQ
jgi:hypothetical protein